MIITPILALITYSDWKQVCKLCWCHCVRVIDQLESNGGGVVPMTVGGGGGGGEDSGSNTLIPSTSTSRPSRTYITRQ